MFVARVEQLRIRPRRWRQWRFRVWRDWCFARFVVRHFRVRFAFILLVVLAGALLFRGLEPERGHSMWRAVYFTWLLVFGQPPEELPQPLALRIMFFVMPLLGLTVVIEAIVEFSHMVRDRRRNEQRWCRMMAGSLSNHIIVIGMGKLGYRSFQMLRRLGEPMVIIECDAENQFLDEVRRDGYPLLIGDARREAMLEDANIAAARSVIIATDDDLANLEIALDARRLKPGIRVVLRMFDQNMADKIREGFNIHFAMSQSAMSAPSFAMAALDRSIAGSLIVDNHLIVVQRSVVGADGALAGRTVADVLRSHGFSVIRHTPAGGSETLFPPPETRLKPGDELLLQGPFDALERFRIKAGAAA